MITNLKCLDCDFQTVCMAHNKMKPFFAEARTDLGVELDFVHCNNYVNSNDCEIENESVD